MNYEFVFFQGKIKRYNFFNTRSKFMNLNFIVALTLVHEKYRSVLKLMIV